MSDRQLDIEVALFVMGQKYAGPCPLGAEDCPGVYEPKIDAPTPCLPRYSTDISAAWKVVEKLCRSGFTANIEWKGAGRGYEFTAEVSFTRNVMRTSGHGVGTAPEAICRAALMAVRMEKAQRQEGAGR